ncbi:Ff.00g046830.m01.CDS01 [Fusarium sp. VM40]|nr:Ff.00g046830.m01.CDS01 [Fusarium sp. VM40]
MSSIYGKQSSNISPDMGISWAFPGSEQQENLETSRVQVVPGLEQDLILGDSTEELYQSVHLTPPKDSQDQASSVSCLDKDFTHQLNSPEDFARHGLVPVNQQSQDKLKYYVDLYSQKAQPPLLRHSTSDSRQEEVERPFEAREYLHVSAMDTISHASSDENWVVAFKGSASGQNSYSTPPVYLNSSDANSKQDASERSTDAVSRHSRPNSPTSGWSLVDGNTCITSEEEDENQGGNEARRSDFEMHPGHRFWEWDIQKQLWRRRGRSGQDEKDWFTEKLLQ